jgi:hypothetical protein
MHFGYGSGALSQFGHECALTTGIGALPSVTLIWALDPDLLRLLYAIPYSPLCYPLCTASFVASAPCLASIGFVLAVHRYSEPKLQPPRCCPCFSLELL